MDPNLLNALIGFGTGIGANLTTSALSYAFQKVFEKRPDLLQQLTQPTSHEAYAKALGEAAGVLEALAGTGQITINNAFVSALKSANFDHQNGAIRIGKAFISAPILQTGGTGSGTTLLSGGTTLKSAGTSIQIGRGASIQISGNASIRQT